MNSDCRYHVMCTPGHVTCVTSQAHREVFEYLIEDFKTYKPLLSAIKTEYELYISQLQQTIEKLEPLSVGVASLVTLCASWPLPLCVGRGGGGS